MPGFDRTAIFHHRPSPIRSIGPSIFPSSASLTALDGVDLMVGMKCLRKHNDVRVVNYGRGSLFRRLTLHPI